MNKKLSDYSKRFPGFGYADKLWLQNFNANAKKDTATC